MKLLSKDDINKFLGLINHWNLNGNTIEKDFVLQSFTEALSFLLKCGIEAEKLDHHPDMLLYGWNKVKVTISTHSLGGLTEVDFNLAKQIDKIN